MKTVLAAAMLIALGITVIFLWGAGHAQRIDVSSSQIFIHGTPVCVMQHAGEIVASVGTCGAPGSGFRDEGGFHGDSTSPRGPRLGLPPGHPPVDSSPDLERERRILI